MRPKGRRAAMVLLLALAGCSSGPSPTPAPTPVPTPLGEVTFHARNIHLGSGPDEVRIEVQKHGDARVVIAGPAVDICPVPALSQKGSTSETCTHGTTASFPEDAVAIRTTTAVTLNDIAITYSRTARRVSLVLGAIPPASGDCASASCAPTFDLVPRRAGTLRATVTWDGIAAGRLSIFDAGRPVSKQQASSDRGASRLRASATVRREARVVLENVSARPLLTPRVTIAFP